MKGSGNYEGVSIVNIGGGHFSKSHVFMGLGTMKWVHSGFHKYWGGGTFSPESTFPNYDPPEMGVMRGNGGS